MLSSRIGRMAILAAAVAAAAAATSRRAQGDLDRISADGVTERGGSPEYARMLPRTGADGRLDASLLPPAADWASQPIARLYYAAAGAARQGNGSPQYPFTTLTHAFTNMVANSALFMAPGTYSGAVTLADGTSLTLLGAGGQPYVSSLSVTAVGSSASTTLDLCGVRVGTLSVAGGRVNVRLAGTSIARLVGTSPSVTVTRTDLGSTIGVSTLTHVDAYTGYDTVPASEALVDPASAGRLTLSGDRATVTAGGQSHTVAYMSDVAGATNSAYGAVQALWATNSTLSARIDAERTARAAGDTLLSNRINAVEADVGTRIAGVGTSWNSRLATLASSLAGTQGELAALYTKETNDVRVLERSIAGVQADYRAADTSLDTRLSALQSSVSSLSGGLNARIAATATTVANARIEAMRGSIESNATETAVGQANIYADGLASSLGAQIDGNYGTLSARISAVEGVISRANTLTTTLNALIASLANAQDGNVSLTNKYHISLPARVQ